MKFNTTGKADIIVRSYAAEKTFKKGQPITILKDVSYNLEFHSENREMRAGVKNLAAFANYAPYQLRVEPVNITRSLAEILYKERLKKETFDLTVNENQMSNEEGEVFLLERNEDGVSILKKDVFVLSKAGEVISAAIDHETGTISNLKPEEFYNITYYIESSFEIGYKLGKTNIPYLTLEIINRDDYGKQGVGSFTLIPKAQLIIEPDLNYDRDNITNISLVFNILEEDIEMYFY